jgi:hypothetical protein
MKRIIAGLMVFLTGALFSGNIQAQPPLQGAKHHQLKQERRIHHGVRNGELTRKEAARLQMQQAKIHHDKKCARANGVVTPYERAYIKSEQARASRNIYHQKHDGQHRF